MTGCLTSRSSARVRLEIVTRLSMKRPLLAFAEMCVKPRKLNVSGLPRTPPLAATSGVPPQLDQVRLLGVRFHCGLSEPASEESPDSRHRTHSVTRYR